MLGGQRSSDDARFESKMRTLTCRIVHVSPLYNTAKPHSRRTARQEGHSTMIFLQACVEPVIRACCLSQRKPKANCDKGGSVLVLRLLWCRGAKRMSTFLNLCFRVSVTKDVHVRRHTICSFPFLEAFFVCIL